MVESGIAAIDEMETVQEDGLLLLLKHLRELTGEKIVNEKAF
jgi:hypothetical protein